ncbi:MAG TPA: hypothetical protein ACFYEL_10160 [Candidatus Wunengus californicus]|uniref:hypothetical protein n=1 Tax=Candidatus Wunengus californicus TaxID=3367619 RepID=UPI004024ADF1
MTKHNNFGRLAGAVGRLAQEALYTEVMPKGVVDYEPRYLTSSPLVMAGRNIARTYILREITHMGFSHNANGGPMDMPYMIPTMYLLADMAANVGLWGYNTYRNWDKNARRHDRKMKDSLDDQPATIAIELPYRTVRGVVDIVKRIGGNRPKAPSGSV